MVNALDYLGDSLNVGLSITKRHFTSLIFNLFKLEILSVVIAGIGLIPLIVVGFYYLGNLIFSLNSAPTRILPSFGPEALLLVLGVFLFLIVASLIASVFKALGYAVVRDTSENKKTAIFSQFKKNFLSVILVEIIISVVSLILLIPSLFAYASASSGFLSRDFFFVGVYLFSLVSLLLLLIFSLGMQFSVLEVVLSGKGPIAALKSSWSIFRNNIFSVILLDVLLLVFALLYGMATGIIESIFRFLLSSLAASGLIGGTIYLILNFIFSALLSLFLYSFFAAVLLPITYVFWKGLKS